MNTPIMNFLAVDPGDVHQGVAYFEIEWAYDPETEKGKPTLWRHWTRDLSRAGLISLLEDASIDAIVLEEFRLYPELAREQGYSDFKTPRMIGVVEYIAEQRLLPCFLQGASVKKKSRRIGERLGFPGKIRMLGAGRNRYRGWDYDGPSQHERDATAHGVWWAFNGDASCVKGLHEKRECRLALAGAAA